MKTAGKFELGLREKGALVADRSMCDPALKSFLWEDRSAYARISRSNTQGNGVLQTSRGKSGSADREVFCELFFLACLTRLRG
jgi:hypothetical protein